jgi:hypothetical protein
MALEVGGCWESLVFECCEVDVVEEVEDVVESEEELEWRRVEGVKIKDIVEGDTRACSLWSWWVAKDNKS